MELGAIKSFSKFLYDSAFKYKHGIRWLLAIAVAIIIIFLYTHNVFERLELLTLDYRFMLRNQQPKPSDIVFIDMAEDSIDAIGRWPWPRKWHAALINALTDYKPKLIAFDVLFAEPQDEENDAALEEAIKLSGRVYLSMLYNFQKQSVGDLYNENNILSVIQPIPRFKSCAKGFGHINAMPDSDGILRRVPLKISYANMFSYQLGARIGFELIGLKSKDILFDRKKHEMLLKMPDNKSVKVPLDKNNQMIINWQGKWGKEFKHYSYIDVIKSYAAMREGKKPVLDLNEFKDKICIIGLTAAGLIDIKPIPIESAYPAVGVHAMVINSIIKDDFIREVPRYVDIFIIILLSILITLFLSNIKLLSGMLLAIVSIISYFIFSVALFKFFNIVILTFYPMLTIIISYSLTSIYTQIVQSTERARLFKQATRDGLTSLYNIRHFNLLLEAEFRNVSLYKFRKLALIMGDIDNFKHVNDTYGHQAGDTILKEVAKTMQTKCRQIDVVARYGGEEFIVMLSGAGEKDAFEVADKIRTAVESKKFKFKNDMYHTTISLGVSEYSGEKDKDELVEKADRALYKAKREGKNRVCLSSTCEPSA